MEIKIGADELILWIRKNGIAKSTTNEGAYGLGFRICRVIESLGGEKIEDNAAVSWPIADKSIVNKLNLPETAAQYNINIELLPAIYRELLKL